MSWQAKIKSDVEANSVPSSAQGRRLIDLEWIDLEVPPHELRPNATLNMGQCFNWKKLHGCENYWVGSLGSRAVAVRQLPDTTEFACLYAANLESVKLLKNDLYEYFQLQHKLQPLYEKWGAACPRMEAVVPHLKGVRVVRQEPWECLVSFICSSNNNIIRITQMLDKLKYHYGEYQISLVYAPLDSTEASNIGGGSSDDTAVHWLVLESAEHRSDNFILPSAEKIAVSSRSIDPVTADDGQQISINGRPAFQRALLSPASAAGKRVKQEVSGSDDEESSTASKQIISKFDIATDRAEYHFYRFPSVKALAEADETDLRHLGMGYRAKFIVGSAKKVIEKQADYADGDWLSYLRSLSITPDSKASTITDTAVSGSEALAIGNNRLVVQEQLCKLPGVGRKVADCVALFSLDQPGAIPVDTHVWSIVTRDYAPDLRHAKSLTPTIYEEVNGAESVMVPFALRVSPV